MEMQHPILTNCPCDLTLVANGGKEFKAHRSVLSEASPFFDRLLKTDMKESREGVIRLEQFSESIMKNILDFIYTGCLEVSLTNAENLIEAADYLLLPDFQNMVLDSLARSLTLSNSISTFYFAKRNHFEKLLDETSRFIHPNFAAVATTETFLNLSLQEVKKWIRRNGLFKLKENEILELVRTWVDFDKGKRMGTCEKLFLPVIATSGGDDTFCYLPGAQKKQWYSTASSKYNFKEPRQLLSLNGSLYNFSLKLFGSCFLRWSPRFSQWSSLALPSKLIPERAALLGDVVYGVGSRSSSQQKFICKYNLDSNSWEAVPLSEADINNNSCIVGHQKCLYFMGGKPVSEEVSRFDTTKSKWEKMKDMQYGRYNAFGAAHQENIYIAGGINGDCFLQSCEVYSIARDEWQFIASLNVSRSEASMVCHLGTLYVLGGLSKNDRDTTEAALTVERYDGKENKWEVRTVIPSHVTTEPDSCKFQACLLTIYEEYLDYFQLIEP